MTRTKWVGFALTVVALCGVATADTKATPSLSAEQIAQKNMMARGGQQAWRAVQSMSYTGKMEVGGGYRAVMTTSKRGMQVPHMESVQQVQLPFVIELKRPRKERIEIEFNGQTALQVFDGANGWKVRPYLNRDEVEPFTPEELRMAYMQADIDGPLMDYAAKGSKLAFDGVEKVENRDSYRLKLTTSDGRTVRVWIDAETFLETKLDGTPRRMDGVEHAVEVYYRDYRNVDGLKVPFSLETRVLPLPQPAKDHKVFRPISEKITIEKAIVNPKLDDARFAKPHIGPAVSSKPVAMPSTEGKGQ